MVYFDSDILFFNASDAVSEFAESEGDRILNHVVERKAGHVSKGPMFEYLKGIGLDVPNGFNSGFLTLPANALEVPFLEACLSGARRLEAGEPVSGRLDGALMISGWDYHASQTLIGAIAAASHRAHQLEHEKYVHTSTDINPFGRDLTPYDEIVLRHFFGNVRHRMYMNGMPAAIRRIKQTPIPR